MTFSGQLLPFNRSLPASDRQDTAGNCDTLLRKFE